MKETRGEAPGAVSRRSFVVKSAAAVANSAVAASGLSLAGASPMEAQAGSRGAARPPDAASSRASSFLHVLRQPDAVTAYASFDDGVPGGRVALQRSGEEWTGSLVQVECSLHESSLTLTLSAPSSEMAFVHVRWQVRVDPTLLVLGDAWERSYGELGWRNLIAERVMPWYFATSDRRACHGYGVKTDARALCFWQLDADGVSLWLNVCNGGRGVVPGQRRLVLATIVARRGADGEDAFDEVSGLCKEMCARPSRPLQPVYGANDWNYRYGNSTAETILQDTEFIASLTPSGGARPFSVIDDGWDKGPPAWPDMAKLAADIRQRSVRPGIWIRPLKAPSSTAPALLLPGARFGARKDRADEFAYDPTVPEAQEKVRDKVRQVRNWSFEMVKHDFSTYDLLGQWGFEMGPRPTLPGWSLHDRSRTNAEVIADLYALIRETAGEKVLLGGCNTVGHLGQGVFDTQRTGDDTSGKNWERTRRMGVNTVSFRLAQHGSFFAVDPDMVGITEAIPWAFNRQWLDMLACSGTATIVAAGPPAHGAEQQAAIREAFQIAAAGGLGARPVDWMETSAPTRWHSHQTKRADSERVYDWDGADGASPFIGG